MFKKKIVLWNEEQTSSKWGIRGTKRFCKKRFVPQDTTRTAAGSAQLFFLEVENLQFSPSSNFISRDLSKSQENQRINPIILDFHRNNSPNFYI